MNNNNISIGRVCALLVVFAFKLLPLACDSMCFASDEVEQGKKIYMQILNRYPKLDVLSRKPFLWLEFNPDYTIKSDPLVEITIPTKDWNSLSEADREFLAKYVSSLVNEVKANPFVYSNIPASAPIAPRIRQSVSNMTSDSWIIHEGELFEDEGEQKMSPGKALLSGKKIKQ